MIASRDSERLQVLRQKLELLRTLDRKLSVFGSGMHKYKQLPCLTEAQLHDAEHRLGAQFPEEMAAFLTTVHGGGAGPSYGFRVLVDIDARKTAAQEFPYDLAAFNALMRDREEDRYASLPMSEDDAGHDNWPPGFGFLTIADLGCGVVDAIILHGELRGSIWCCDMAWRPHTNGPRLIGFLDWYEQWLDDGLRSCGARKG